MCLYIGMESLILGGPGYLYKHVILGIGLPARPRNGRPIFHVYVKSMLSANALRWEGPMRRPAIAWRSLF